MAVGQTQASDLQVGPSIGSLVVCAIYLYIGLWLTAEGFWFDYGGPPLMFVAFVFFGLFLFLPALMCEFWVPKFGAKMMIFVAIIGGLGLLTIPVPDPDMFSEFSEYKWWMKTLGFGVLLPYWIASFAILLTATKSRKFTLRELIWAVTLTAIALGTCGAVIRKATPYQIPAIVDEPSLTSQVFDVRRRHTKARTNDESWHPNVCQARFCHSRWNVCDCRIFAILKERQSIG